MASEGIVVDTRSFRLQIDGHVQRPLSLSLDDLHRRFEPASVIAIAQGRATRAAYSRRGGGCPVKTRSYG
jgi:Oxidoreductase molybdopterin binding domain